MSRCTKSNKTNNHIFLKLTFIFLWCCPCSRHHLRPLFITRVTFILLLDCLCLLYLMLTCLVLMVSSFIFRHDQLVICIIIFSVSAQSWFWAIIELFSYYVSLCSWLCKIFRQCWVSKKSLLLICLRFWVLKYSCLILLLFYYMLQIEFVTRPHRKLRHMLEVGSLSILFLLLNFRILIWEVGILWVLQGMLILRKCHRIKSWLTRGKGASYALINWGTKRCSSIWNTLNLWNLRNNFCAKKWIWIIIEIDHNISLRKEVIWRIVWKGKHKRIIFILYLRLLVVLIWVPKHYLWRIKLREENIENVLLSLCVPIITENTCKG